MSGLFWQLPGPSLFLERVAQSFRDGRNVFIIVPEHGPARIRYAIAELVNRRELHAWHPIDASEDTSDAPTPAEIVARQCISGVRPCTVKELSEHEQFRHMIVWVDGIDPGSWGSWRDFLQEYSHLCRARPQRERAVFCLPVLGAQIGDLPAEDVVCAVHVWRGVVTRLDMTLFFSHLLAARSVTRMHAKLWNAVGVELAGTDSELAIHLARADLPSVLAPAHILQEFARGRGWRPWGAEKSPSWSLGDEDVLDGKSILHSARVILEKDGRDEIERRLWRGQVGTLFPFVEEQRVELIARFRSFLRVPHETPFGTITDIRDFELGHLLYQVRKRNIDEPTRRLLGTLTDIRHRLAHLESVPYELLASPELAGRFA
ncbi:hypothetical protein [Chondromyces apiculatus]|uniref:hypothetical protein n=1 Tax=Chondromyces apiculatus TaxID=51 RepID=UPI0012DBFA5E|nr:hypothetical protein [Chondromyces apiculatus]